MPRPDKDIRPGDLDGPVSSPRAHSWTKYGGPETIEGHRGAPSSVDESLVEVTVDDITVTEYPDAPSSKYMTRATAAHGVGVEDEVPKMRPVDFVREWSVDRTVEGRTYRRIDQLRLVELDG